MKRIASALGISACLLAGGCQLVGEKEDRPGGAVHAGGGSRTTNGEVAGRVKLADASPAEGAQVRLFRIRLGDDAEIHSGEWAGISDSLGRFSFRSVPAGRFSLSVTHAAAGTRAIVARIQKDTAGHLVFDGLLTPWVDLVGRVLPGPGVEPTSVRVCIPGLDGCVHPGPDSVFVFPRAPQGRYDLVFLAGSVAYYLPIAVASRGQDIIHLKDIPLDSAPKPDQAFQYYETDGILSSYVLPRGYRKAEIPPWYVGKDFSGARYFRATAQDQFEQWDVEDYQDWKHSRIVAMPLYRPVGSDRTPLREFPCFLRLTRAELDFAQARPGGEDFRISRGDGTHLAYSITRWDSAAGLAELWVNIDQMAPETPTQQFNLRWGNEDATDRSDPSAVLGPVPGRRQQWGFDDRAPNSLVRDARGTHPGYLTRIGSGKDTTARNAVPGTVGGALRMDGVSDLITIDPHPEFDHPEFTLSLWARNAKAKLAAQEYLVLKGEEGRKQWHLALDPTHRVRVGLGRADGRWSGAWISRDPVDRIDAWHHYAVTYAGGKVRVFVDGVELAAGKPNGTLPPSLPLLDSPLFLGRGFLESESFWSGDLDNLQLDREVRAADWIRLLYETQKLP